MCIILVKILSLYYINFLKIMTAGGLIQLVTATGEQDRYLTGNPEITFFKTVYRRHTNFAIETIDEVFYSGEDFGKQCRCIIPRSGDLISNITLYVNVGSLNPDFYERINKNSTKPHIDGGAQIDENGNVINTVCECYTCLEERYKNNLTYGWVNSLGHALIESFWLEIGGQRIDKQYGEWLEIWTELTQTAEKNAGYNQMIGKVDPSAFRATTFTGEMELYIPLTFWFCRNIGLSLPIMALFYHPVELVVNFRKFNELWVSNKKNVAPPVKPRLEGCLLIDYIYLDIEERRQFYEESQIYLIEQLQFSETCPIIGSSGTIDLYFNHPVKELVWVLQRDDVKDPPDGVFPGTNYPKGNDLFNFSPFLVRNRTTIEDTFDEGFLQFNGIDRFRRRKASYFRLYHPYNYHTRIPSKYIYVYSFGFRPEEHNPTGQMNFSRVDNSRLTVFMKNRRSFSNYNIRVYATNYNILVISAGMGGILFYN